MSDFLSKLAAPFPADKISWRIGSTTGDKKKGMALAYIDSRDVQDRLDAVCGVDWQVRYPWCVGERMTCEIGIRLVHPTRGGEYEWVWRGDGAGSTDVEADKGAFSDAFKRAAVRWGIGRYLYDLDSPWVELEPAGKSYKIAAHEYARLRRSLEGKAVSTPRPTPKAVPAPQQSPAADDLKAQAEALVKKIKAADTIFKLDTVMEDSRDLCKKLPKPTYDYIGKLYDQRRTAMECAA